MCAPAGGDGGGEEEGGKGGVGVNDGEGGAETVVEGGRVVGKMPFFSPSWFVVEKVGGLFLFFFFLFPNFVLAAVVGDVEEKEGGREGGREGLVGLVVVWGSRKQEEWTAVMGVRLEEARTGGGGGIGSCKEGLCRRWEEGKGDYR